LVLDSAYLAGLLVAVPYLVCGGKSHQLVDHVLRRLRSVPERRGSEPCVWVHGVSVGEILSVRHFLRLFSAEFPRWKTVLSTTTRAGLEIAQRTFPGKQVFSYPFDLSFLVKRAFDRIRPQLVVIVEHELWPNFLQHAEARGVPVVIVNGRLSERSLKGYRWLSRVLDWPPPGVFRFCVEDQLSAEGFRQLGVASERIEVTGNFKFDNAAGASQPLRDELGFDSSEWVLVAASTHRGEESVLLDSFSRLYGEDRSARLVIAPRRVERAGEIMKAIRRRGFEACLWSQARAGRTFADHGHNGNGSDQNGSDQNGSGGGSNSDSSGRRVVLIDTVGEIQRVSAAGDVVFVGGSLVPFGGHNVIEPASLGRPVVIGPHYHNFRQVVAAFEARDAVLVARDGPDLLEKLRELKRDPARARGMGRRATDTVLLHAGASERTIEVLRPFIAEIEARHGASL
jgi:3-deoxy-D-manno-octulosonic-acid transferase